MPVVKKSDGWYWGSKGPFGSKAKAMSVGRAAYASGYREEMSMDQTAVAEFVGTLLHSATVTHFYHLQAEGPGSYAAHQALGTYYDEVVDLVDGLAESIQGIYGIIEPYPSTFGNPTNTTPLAYMKSLQAYVRQARQDMPDDSEVQNEIDGIMTLINHTVYKLERLA